MKSTCSFFYASCLTLLLLSGGCNDHSELPNGTDSEWKPIEVSSCRTPLGADVVTRASALTEIKGGTLGLYRKPTNGYTALNNVRYTYHEATLETAAQWMSDDASKAIYVNAATASIYALYPYMEIGGAATNGHGFDGTYVTGMHQQRYYGDSRNEVMISGEVPANNRVPRLELVMKHIYSRLTLRIKNVATETILLKSITLKPKTAYTTEARVNVSTTALTPEQTNTSLDGYSFPFEADDEIYTKGILSDAVDESIEMLWIPQTFAADMEITIVFRGAKSLKETTLTATLPQAHLPKLDQATRYTLPLLVAHATIIIGGAVTVQDWGDQIDMGTPPDINI